MKYVVGTILLVMLGAKVWLAAHLDLYADEVFYYQCSLRPALAYADLPPLTAMCAKLGTWAFGASPFGVRLPFLVLGFLVPLVLYHLACPLTNRQQAAITAGIALILPQLAFLSIFAIPDVLLAIETAAFLLFFERATRTDDLKYWLSAGVVAGLGLMTHYRFATTIAAVFIYLVSTQRGRACLRRPGIWLTGFAALPGLGPALIYNWQHDFEPLRYFLLTRHDSHIRPRVWADHLLEQMAVVSPVLWALLIFTLFRMWRKARSGDDRAGLFVIFAVVPLGLFWLASPLQTTGAQSFHWALPGYLPLLVYLPETMTHLARSGRQFFLGRLWVWSGLGLAVAMLALAMLELGTGWVGIRGFREPFTGWSQAVRATQDTLEALKAKGVRPQVIVADNYKLGGQLELALGEDWEVYILAHSKNFEHGRERQYDRWDIGERALRNHAGAQVLVVVQWSELAGSKAFWQEHLDWFFNPLEPLGEFQFIDGSDPKYDKKFTFYLGRIIEKR